MSDDKDLEREKSESYELGRISQLNDVADDLRGRAGELWADSSARCDIEKARQLKELASEFEDEASEQREQWEDEYK